MTRHLIRARWAISFADLSLLLLGFFVLLQANQASRDAALKGLGTYFGAIAAPHQADLRADQLFEPGEALLSTAGRNALLQTACPFATGDGIVMIQSLGLASGEHRFDNWDLSAARLGAIARALVAAGLPERRIRIAGLAEQKDAGQKDGGHRDGQIIRLITQSAARDSNPD